MKNKNKIAILIPCYNEEMTIKEVIEDFKKELPNAFIYVYNNNSTDNTALIAKKAGAIVVDEYQQGKGNVVRSMFRDIDADVYIMVDGDNTYPSNEVHKLIEPVQDGKADMVIGDRLSSTYYSENKRLFHNFGNNLVRLLVNKLFNANLNDIMTGYRAFSKRFVKSVPILSDGFQIETEISIFSLVYKMNIVEVPIAYRDRPKGSVSKLNTFQDGYKVLLTLFNLFKDNRPFLLFGTLSIILSICSLIIGIPTIIELFKSSSISNQTSAIVASILLVFAFIMFSIGIIMDAIKNEKQFITTININRIINELQNKS